MSFRVWSVENSRFKSRLLLQKDERSLTSTRIHYDRSVFVLPMFKLFLFNFFRTTTDSFCLTDRRRLTERRLFKVIFVLNIERMFIIDITFVRPQTRIKTCSGNFVSKNNCHPK